MLETLFPSSTPSLFPTTLNMTSVIGVDEAAIAFGFGVDIVLGTMVVEGASYLILVTRKKDVGKVKHQSIFRVTYVFPPSLYLSRKLKIPGHDGNLT